MNPAAAAARLVPVQGNGSREPALAFGVDVVAMARSAELLSTFGDAIVRRVCTEPEAAWVGRRPERLGALLGLKEAAIKAMAGRPRGFRWQFVRTGLGQLSMSMVDDDGSAPAGGLPPAAVTVLREFGAALSAPALVGCLPMAGCRDRLAAQLPGPGEVVGAGIHGADGDHVYAAVCFWKALEGQ